MILPDFSILSRLPSQAIKLEKFIKEKEKRKRACFSNGQTMISVIEDISEEEDNELVGDVMVAEIISVKTYT